MTEKQLRAGASRLEEFASEVLAGLGRSERRQHGALYVQGLLLDGDRKSIEPLAARVPGGNVQALQQLVGQSPWAWEPVREQLGQRMQEALLPVAGWIIDDTGFPKQGSESVGVARQYSGTLGKVGNCQIAVSIHLTTEEESMPLDWALYLPQDWMDDPERCPNRSSRGHVVSDQIGTGFGADRSHGGVGVDPSAGVGRRGLRQKHGIPPGIGGSPVAICGGSRTGHVRLDRAHTAGPASSQTREGTPGCSLLQGQAHFVGGDGHGSGCG